ncbi:MAG: hypothetical protein CMN96_04890 [Synechococcus sp. MED850]|nr:hypothetical protein [Synechococcus sp. MED850]OUW98180.1 MAG: hypothetical protein CBD89_03610 [Cyanobacteria bacterium TMED229]
MSLFSANNRVPLTVPGSTAESPSINVDSNLRRWFSRNLGLWRSRRQYHFSDDQVMHLDMNLKMEAFAEPQAGETRYRFSWWPESGQSDEFFERKPWYEKEGVMEATLWGHQLQRSRGYLNADPVRTRLRQVDEHETILESHYQQWDILEHIRLVDQDRFRYRAIYSWENGQLAIVEHHHEIRLEDPLPPIPDK